MDRLFPLALILFFAILLTSGLLFAEPVDVKIQRYNDSTQKTFAYAGKLYWDERSRKWEKKIVVYNKGSDS